MDNVYKLKELTFEITKKCPMRCILCSSEGGDACSREFSLDKIKNIIDDAIELGTEHVNLSGGEPLIHSQIIDICHYIKDKGLTLDVYTCGNIEDIYGHLAPINNKLLEELKTVEINSLIFSIHGSDSTMHDYITAKQGSFENLIKSINNSIKLGIFTEMHFVPTKINYQSLPDIMKLTDKLQTERLSVLRFVPQGRGRINRDKLEIKSNEIEKLKNILHDNKNNYFSSKFRVGSPFNCFQLSNPTFCTAGIDKATIKPDGSVFPCVSMKDFVIEKQDNNLWNNTLFEIWDNSTIFNISRKSLQIIEESSCKYCKHVTECKGGCLTQRLICNKLEDRDPYCQFEISSTKKEEIQLLH